MRWLIGVVIILFAACSVTDTQDADRGQKTTGSTTLDNGKNHPVSTGDDAIKDKTTAKTYTPIRFNLKDRRSAPSEADRQRCLDVGGRVQRAGLGGIYHCIQEYPDGGNTCRDSSECLGHCRTTDSKQIGKPGTGSCQKVDVSFGCYALVRDGMVDGGMLCID